jgi:hypothetical protein
VSNNLNAQKALIFRIVHCHNVPWILDQGIHCGSSTVRDPEYITIGNIDLIAKRSSRVIPVHPKGTLDNYVPFYFTPYSPMMLNIKTGYNGIRQRANEDIAILVSSLPRLVDLGVPFVFADRHAYLNTAQFSSSLNDLDRIDWKILQNRDFKRDQNDLEKFDRYQAEALVFKRFPVEAILGIGCFNDKAGAKLKGSLDERNLNLQLTVRPTWYF